MGRESLAPIVTLGKGKLQMQGLAASQQAELAIAHINFAALLETHPQMPPLAGPSRYFSFGMLPGDSEAGKQQRVDEVADWLGVHAMWRNGVYFAQRDMGYGRLIIDAHYAPAATIAEISTAIREGRAA